MSEETEEGWRFEPIVEFLDQSPQFSLGFEAGRLYAQMEEEYVTICGHYQVENEEQHINTAQKLGYTMTDREPPAEGWVWMEFEKR